MEVSVLKQAKPFLGVAVLAVVAAGLIQTPLNAGTITYTASPIGPNLFNLSYLVSGFDLLANQAIDIRYDPAVYLSLSNATTNSQFNKTLLQPDNPPGSFGSYSLLALVDHPTFPASFSLDLSLQSGVTSVPTTETFQIEQFDSTGHFVGVLGTGTATSAPEPSGAVLVLIGLGALGMRARFASARS